MGGCERVGGLSGHDARGACVLIAVRRGSWPTEALIERILAASDGPSSSAIDALHELLDKDMIEASATPRRVAEAARLAGLPTHTLRYYEQEGLGVFMTAVARAAGVGSATLLRRFRTREEPIAAVFTDRVATRLAVVTAALDDPHPWQGFTGYVQSVGAGHPRAGFSDGGLPLRVRDAFPRLGRPDGGDSLFGH